MIHDSSSPREPGTNCPKQLWVLNALSDDEAATGPTLPSAIRLHLSRCASCRALADRIQAVTAQLGVLADMKPDESLGTKADAQALAALDAGASLTGRVTIPFEETRVEYERVSKRSIRSITGAAAAVILLAVGVYWMTAFSASQPPATVHHPQPGEPDMVEFLAKQAPPAETGDRQDKPAEGEPPPAALSTPDQRLVRTGRPTSKSASRPRPRELCHHHSYLEAAMCDRPGAVHSAVISNRPARRKP